MYKAVLLVSMLTITAAPAFAVVDVNYTVAGGGFGPEIGGPGLDPIYPALVVNQTIYQTFTVGITGSLTKIGVQAYLDDIVRPGPGNAPLRLSILPTVAGVPQVSAAALATGDVSAAKANDGESPTTIPMVDIKLGTALAVTKGEVLAIAMSTDPGTDYLWENNFPLDKSPAYAGGSPYVSQMLYQGGAWIGPMNLMNIPGDLGFETFVRRSRVAAPEPMGSVVLGVGLLGLLFARSRNGHQKS